MASKKMQLEPPRPKSAEEFVEAANNYPDVDTEEVSSIVYPWNDEKVRDDVIKSINLRLSEPYILKLQYLSDLTNKSQQAIIREVLLPHIDSQIDQLTNGK